MRDNVLAEKSIAFAIRTANFYKYISANKKETILSKQLYRSGTSIGANIHEAIQVPSKADFINKLNVALKEASETNYWLNILYKTDYLDDKLYKSMTGDCEEIIRILVATIKTAKNNLNK